MRSLQHSTRLKTALIASPLLVFATACQPSDDGNSSNGDLGVEGTTMMSGGMTTETSGTEGSTTEDPATTTTTTSTTDPGTTTMDPETTGMGDECEGYRTEYPAGPYGTAVNSVLADVPGMVYGDGSPVSFMDIYQDTTKVALLIVNAFDT